MWASVCLAQVWNQQKTKERILFQSSLVDQRVELGLLIGASLIYVLHHEENTLSQQQLTTYQSLGMGGV